MTQPQPRTLHWGISGQEPKPRAKYNLGPNNGAQTREMADGKSYRALPWAGAITSEMDMWEEWGEHEPWRGRARIFHFIVPVEDDEEAFMRILELQEAGWSLPAMQWEHQEGIIACITDTDDFSRNVVNIFQS